MYYSLRIHFEKYRDYIVMGETKREDIKVGLRVSIIMKADQRFGKSTEGIVKDILTKSPAHLHGIKVRLVSGQVGRVKEIIN